MRATDYLSATALSKKTSATLDALARGDTEKLIILKNNTPKAVLLSTGKPKGVMLTHANIVANVNSICEYLQLTDSDVQMVVLPFFYVMGKSLLNTHFAAGGTIVINNKIAFISEAK